MNATQHIIKAIQLNDLGTSQLLQHNYEEATRCFEDAVFQMHESINKTHDLREENASTKKPTTTSPTSPSSDLQQYEFVDLEFYKGSPPRFHDRSCYLHGFHDDSMICKTAIRICDSERSASRSSTTTSTGRITLAVVYNLGIATHFWALQEEDEEGSIDKLQKALRYYDIAFRTQTQAEEEGTAAVSGEDHNSIAMCVLNNAASIYMLMGDHQKASEFLRQVISFIFTVGEPSKTKKNEQRIWKSCLSNIIAWLMGPPTTASAA